VTGARCVPRRGRSRPRPARPIPLLAAPTGGFARAGVDQLAATERAGGFVQAAVDAYARTGHRPRWLSDELLAVLERRGRLVGLVYLLHFDRPIGDTSNPRGFAAHYTGRAASSGLLKVLWRADGAEFAELAWMDRMGLPGAPGTPRARRHRLWVVGALVLGAVVGTAVVLGTVRAGAVVVGTATGAVVVGAGPDGDVVVDVPGARVAGGIDLFPPATTTPTDVLPPCRGWVPTKLASGCLATASTTVIAATAIPKASTAATATRCQRIGWGCPWLAPSWLAPSWLAPSWLAPSWLAPSWLAPSWLAPSWLAPAWSPTRRTNERRATLWADASEWVYTASAGATSMLTSAAPIRVPSTPKKDATTAPLTAASPPASNLGTRSCSIPPHLDVRVGDGGAAVWAPWARPDSNPAAASRAPTLATQAVSRQASPGQEGDRASWGSCSRGDRLFIADLVQRTELEAAQGPGGPEVAHDPVHVVPRVHESQRDGTVSDSPAEILLTDHESCSSMRACRARWLTRDNARAALSNALTNSRQIQHWTDDLVRRITKEHRNPRWRGAGRLVQVALAAGLTFELAWLEYPATRGRERRLKNQGSAYRRCPLCRGTGGPLDPAAAVAAIQQLPWSPS
jgi:hypothetical protein